MHLTPCSYLILHTVIPNAQQTEEHFLMSSGTKENYSERHPTFVEYNGRNSSLQHFGIENSPLHCSFWCIP